MILADKRVAPAWLHPQSPPSDVDKNWNADMSPIATAAFPAFGQMTALEQCRHLVEHHGYVSGDFLDLPIDPVAFFKAMSPENRTAWHADDVDPYGLDFGHWHEPSTLSARPADIVTTSSASIELKPPRCCSAHSAVNRTPSR